MQGAPVFGIVYVELLMKLKSMNIINVWYRVILNANEAQGATWILSGCCNPKGCAHLPVVFRRK